MGGSCESTGRRNSASSTAAAAASTKSVSQAEALATQQLRRSGDHKHVLSSNSSVLKCQKNWTILIFFFEVVTSCTTTWEASSGLSISLTVFQFKVQCWYSSVHLLSQMRHRPNHGNIVQTASFEKRFQKFLNVWCKWFTRRIKVAKYQHGGKCLRRHCAFAAYQHPEITTQRRKCWWNAKGNETNINRPLPTNLGLGPSITLQTQSWANKQIVMMCKASRHENMTI